MVRSLKLNRFLLTALLLTIGFACAPAVYADTSSQDAVIPLYPGWNCISVPRVLADGGNNASIFKGVDQANHSMWAFNGSAMRWVRMTDDTKIKPLEGYWVYSTRRVDVPLTYRDDPVQVPPTRKLPAGWSLIGFTDKKPASARDTLITLLSSWTILIGHDAQSQQFESAIVNGGTGNQTDQRLMYPMRGYWVNLKEPADLAAIGV